MLHVQSVEAVAPFLRTEEAQATSVEKATASATRRANATRHRRLKKGLER